MQYPSNWRVLHWLIALCVMGLIPIGLLIEARTEANLWDDLTNLLYSIHKATGFTVLLLMLVRIGFKIAYRTPAYPDVMSRAQVIAAKSLHLLFYVLLVVVPLFGWAGVTAFPALIIVPGFELPGFPGVPQDEALAEKLFQIHGTLALLLAFLILGHIGAALRHLLIRKDGVFQRMWFKDRG